MEKLIFLDIDGVVVSRNWLTEQHKMGKPWLSSEIEFDPYVLGLLKKLIHETDGKIIISSTWRKSDKDMNNLKSQFDKYDIPIYGVTINWATRGMEILKTIRQLFPEFDRDDDRFVVFDDDMFDIRPFISEYKLIKVNGMNGLIEYDIDRAISILNG